MTPEATERINTEVWSWHDFHVDRCLAGGFMLRRGTNAGHGTIWFFARTDEIIRLIGDVEARGAQVYRQAVLQSLLR